MPAVHSSGDWFPPSCASTLLSTRLTKNDATLLAR